MATEEHIWGGGGGLLNFPKTKVSVLHKELEYKIEKLNFKKKLDVMQPRIKNTSDIPTVNKPSRSWISQNEVLEL